MSLDKSKDEVVDPKQDEVKEDDNSKINCECGAVITKRNLSTHKKSQKHIQFVSEHRGAGSGEAIKTFLKTLEEKLDTIIELLLDDYDDDEVDESSSSTTQ